MSVREFILFIIGCLFPAAHYQYRPVNVNTVQNTQSRQNQQTPSRRPAVAPIVEEEEDEKEEEENNNNTNSMYVMKGSFSGDLDYNIADCMATSKVKKTPKKKVKKITVPECDYTKAADDADSEKVCVICLEYERNLAAIPCSHLAYCRKCALVLTQKKEPCAVCRAQIKRFELEKKYYT